jgi:hypothetical protein
MGRRQVELALALAGPAVRNEVDEALERRPIVRELFERVEDLERKAAIGRGLIEVHRNAAGANDTDEIVAFIEGNPNMPVVVCSRCREAVGHPFRGEQPPAVTGAIETPARPTHVELVDIKRMLDEEAHRQRLALAALNANYTRMRATSVVLFVLGVILFAIGVWR